MQQFPKLLNVTRAGKSYLNVIIIIKIDFLSVFDRFSDVEWNAASGLISSLFLNVLGGFKVCNF